MDLSQRAIAVKPVKRLPNRRGIDRPIRQRDLLSDSVTDRRHSAAAAYAYGLRQVPALHPRLYNRRSLADPLQAALDTIVAPLRGQAPSHGSGRWLDAVQRSVLWELVAEDEVAHVQRLDRDGVVARVASTSFIAALAADARAAVLDEVGAVLSHHSEPIELPYVWELFAWKRLP